MATPPLQRLRLDQGGRKPNPIDLPHDLVDVLVEQIIDSKKPCSSVLKLCRIHPEWAALCRDEWILFDAANRALGWYGEQKTWSEVVKFYNQNYPNPLMPFREQGVAATPKAYFKWVCTTPLRHPNHMGSRAHPWFAGLQAHPWFATRLLQIVQSRRARDWPPFGEIDQSIPTYTEIAKLYVSENPTKLQLVPKNHPNFSDIAMVALQNIPRGEALRWVSRERSDFSKLAKFAVQLENNNALMHVPWDREDYKDIALLAMQNDGRMLIDVPPNHPDYFEIAKAAIKQSERALAFVPGAGETFGYHDRFFDLAEYAVTLHATAISWVHPGPPFGSTIRAEYVRLAKLALEHDPWALVYVAKSIDQYRELALQAILEDWRTIDQVPTAHKDYIELRDIANRLKMEQMEQGS